MSNIPILDALKRYNSRNMSSFHTPGHKGVGFKNIDFSAFDLTELPDTDSLYDCSGPILEAEIKTSNLFGSKRTIFSAGGNTLCIQAMLRMCVPHGGKVLAGRVIHRSAVGAMALLGIQPEWVIPSRNAGLGLPGTIDFSTVSEKLKENKDIKSVYITSPDYYGMISDIRGISSACKEYNVPLMVDNAHGSHLRFLKENLHPISLGASIAADSVHKTLPALTGGAWLHISDEKLTESAKPAMALFGSTSPSYPIMCSLDFCRYWLDAQGKNSFRTLEDRVSEIKYNALDKGILLPDGKSDPVRITLNASSIGYSGTELATYLRELEIEPEFSDKNYTVLIPSPFNTDNDFKKLEKAIQKIDVRVPLDVHKIIFTLPRVKLTLREAVMSESVVIPIKNCLNRVAADIVSICPPGIPIVMPGETIEENHIEQLINYGILEIKVVK